VLSAISRLKFRFFFIDISLPFFVGHCEGGKIPGRVRKGSSQDNTHSLIFGVTWVSENIKKGHCQRVRVGKTDRHMWLHGVYIASELSRRYYLSDSRRSHDTGWLSSRVD
jgi:hypothetical protein